MKKKLYILILIILAGIFSPVFQVHAQTSSTNYQLLAPLPEMEENFNTADDSALSTYLNSIIKTIIGLSAVFAVVMIVIGGMEYMTSELVSSKEAGKERIKDALLGLLIALGAWALLNTINPELLKSDVKIESAVITIDMEADVEQTPVNNKYGSYDVGADWQAIAGKPLGLPPFASINRRECTTVGEKFCTSTAGLDTRPLYRIHEQCPSCQLKVTGGTEFWLHGGKTGSTSHQKGNSTMDLGKDSALNDFLSGGQPLIPFHRYNSPIGSVLYEGNHWHIGP